MCRQKYLPIWSSLTFMLGTIIGILDVHLESKTFLTFDHILVVMMATLVFYLTQITSPMSLFKRKPKG